MVFNRVYNKVEDYLMDDEFIRAVLCHSSTSKSYLRKVKGMNKGCSVLYEEARQILLTDKPTITILSEDECIRLKDRIFMTLAI